jgi:hypothetical protein
MSAEHPDKLRAATQDDASFWAARECAPPPCEPPSPRVSFIRLLDGTSRFRCGEDTLRMATDPSRDLTAWRAVEEPPHSEIIGAALELVFRSCCHEQKIAWLEPVALALVE